MKAYLRTTQFYHRYKTAKAYLAVRMYGNPAKEMIVIGVTGTDGKTTTCNIIHYLVQHLLGKALVVGTTGVKIGMEPVAGIQKMTSYDPMDLQKILAQGYDAGCKYAILEVSSHALDQSRFMGIDFTVGVLTNITADHLDRHKTVEEYAESKQKLFHLIAKTPKATAILPKDDIYGRKRIETMNFPAMIDYAIDAKASLMADHIDIRDNGSTAQIQYFGKTFPIETLLVGRYNIANILAATGVLLALGSSVEEVVSMLPTYHQERGRQEKYHHLGCNRWVDFAHTVNGLKVTLEYLQSIKGNGRVICVFGCPGERDIYKRPEMAKIVATLADVGVLTDDDACSEDRRDIIDDARKGVDETLWGTSMYIIPHRRNAIAFVKEMLHPGDVVLMAGKGHEDVYITNFEKEPWSEKEEIYRL